MTGVRNRPRSVTAIDTAVVAVPSAVNRIMRSWLPLSAASTNPPSHAFHDGPSTNVPPAVAMVGQPEDHVARIASGKRARSVIGALSTVPDNQSLRANYNEYNKILQVACVKLLSTTAPVMAIMKETQAKLEQAAPLT